MRSVETFVAGCLIGITACTPLVLAPGASQVRVTKQAADVANCAG